MSSHHIIRENQEGALLILKNSGYQYDILELFLEWSPLLIADNESFSNLASSGIKVDAVICTNEEKLTIEDLLIFQSPIDIVEHGIEQNLMNEGVRYLRKKNSNIIYIFSRSTPSQMFDLQLAFPEIQINFVDGNILSHIMVNSYFEKWLPEHREIKIISKYPKQSFTFNTPIQGNCVQTINYDLQFRQTLDGMVTITSEKDFIIQEVI